MDLPYNHHDMYPIHGGPKAHFLQRKSFPLCCVGIGSKSNHQLTRTHSSKLQFLVQKFNFVKNLVSAQF